MTALNELEKAVLQEMCSRVSSDVGAHLATQVKNVIVRDRNNTGAGFYSKLEINGPVQHIKEKVISNLSATIAGLKNPMVFVLFIRDGVIDLLEGAAIDDSTTNINFSEVTFEIVPKP
jgi:hypothetical protein